MEAHGWSATARRLARRCALLLPVLALAGSGLLATGAAPATADPLPPSASGMQTLNYYRALAGESPAVENTSWSQGDVAHSQYVVANNQVTHTEAPGNPWYTAAGAAAGQNGNVAMASLPISDRQITELWVEGPFHAAGMLDPGLQSSGFGSFSGPQTKAATLDVIRGLAYAPIASPLTFPANGTLVPLTSYVGGEWPDPLAGCPGYAAPTGLPILAILPPGTPAGVMASITANGANVPFCELDGNNYTNADPNAQATGRAVLNRPNAHFVALIPQAPLAAGTTYQVGVLAGGVALRWSFTAGATAGGPGTPSPPGSVSAQPSNAAAAVSWSPSNGNGSPVSGYTVTANAAGFPSPSTNVGGSSTATTVGNLVNGVTYSISVYAQNANGWSAAGQTTVTPNGPPWWPGWNIARAIVPTAPTTGYTLDGFGGVHAWTVGSGPPPASARGEAYWPGWDIVRGMVLNSGGTGGYTVDGWGGVHPFATGANPMPPMPGGVAVWPGWDIVRGIALLPNGTSGYTVDGWGGVHAFGGAPPARGEAYWPGWDIVRGIVLDPSGTGGYTLDGWGGVHPFATGANPMPPMPSGVATWTGWDIVRSIVLKPSGTGGYTLDGFGGIHPFGLGADPSPALPAAGAYWPGWDIARQIVLTGAGSGYTLDGWGGLHAFGS